MYSERRELHPVQPKNQSEFHKLLDDIGVDNVTNKEDSGYFFVYSNNSKNVGVKKCSL